MNDEITWGCLASIVHIIYCNITVNTCKNKIGIHFDGALHLKPFWPSVLLQRIVRHRGRTLLSWRSGILSPLHITARHPLRFAMHRSFLERRRNECCLGNRVICSIGIAIGRTIREHGITTHATTQSSTGISTHWLASSSTRIKCIDGEEALRHSFHVSILATCRCVATAGTWLTSLFTGMTPCAPPATRSTGFRITRGLFAARPGILFGNLVGSLRRYWFLRTRI